MIPISVVYLKVYFFEWLFTFIPDTWNRYSRALRYERRDLWAIDRNNIFELFVFIFIQKNASAVWWQWGYSLHSTQYIVKKIFENGFQAVYCHSQLMFLVKLSKNKELNIVNINQPQSFGFGKFVYLRVNKQWKISWTG